MPGPGAGRREALAREVRCAARHGLLGACVPLLAACATGAHPSLANFDPTGARLASLQLQGTGAQAGNPNGGASAGGPVEIVRYVGVDARGWSTASAPHGYSDLYTRLILESRDAAGSVAGTQDLRKRDYVAENRSWGARLLSSRTDTVTAILNVAVKEPGLALSLPLFSLSHASGLKLGNTWNTVFTASSVESPLFRLGPNTAVTVHLTAKVSSDLKSQGASLAVSAVTTAVKIAAPTSALLTTMSKSETSNAATAIDTALSSLLSEDISEDVEVGRLLASWEPGKTLAFAGCAPFVRTVGRGSQDGVCPSERDFGGAGDVSVGTWRLRLACPRLSAFDTADVCTADGSAIDGALWNNDAASLAAARARIASSVSDAQILSFDLSSQTTVQAYVLAQPWFTTFVAMSARQPSDYAAFCSAGVVALEADGLNSLDAALVVRAMIRQLPQLAPMRADFANGKPGGACAAALQGAAVPVV